MKIKKETLKYATYVVCSVMMMLVLSIGHILSPERFFVFGLKSTIIAGVTCFIAAMLTDIAMDAIEKKLEITKVKMFIVKTMAWLLIPTIIIKISSELVLGFSIKGISTYIFIAIAIRCVNARRKKVEVRNERI